MDQKIYAILEVICYVLRNLYTSVIHCDSIKF